MMMRKSISGKKVLVTGASGFIGSHLCRRLMKCGAIVHAVSRSPLLRDANCSQWWQADVAEIDTVRRLFSSIGPDIIFHLASHVMGAPDIEHVIPTFRNNLQTSVNLLTVSAERGCQRLVLTGSLVEPDRGVVPDVPSAPYAAAKRAASEYARMFNTIYKLPVVIARVFMVYGPGQKDETKLIPYVIRMLLQGKAPMITSGQRLIDWIYIDDVIKGFVDISECSGIDGETIDLGSGHLITIHDIVQLAAKLVGSEIKPLFGALLDRPLEPLRKADTASSESKIGWKPAVSLENGLMQTIEWIKSQHWEEP